MGPVSPSECLFCRIAGRGIETAVLYEDERAMGFRDINPKAPVHLLVIPKEHIESLLACGEEQKGILGHLLWVANRLADAENLARDGYRVVLNVGTYGGQTVPHLHVHLLGGRSFGWPPG
jgi:histidine triad (HIT) family protein